jgi:CheY-like chemotaxis protein
VSFLKKPKRILVVDDEPLIIDVTSEYLLEAGFEVGSANSSAQALAEMEKSPADVMLLDIRLPDEDGLSFLQRFKKLYPNVPVVILTGSGYDENLMQTALQNGASGYVSKDTDLGNMVVAVKRLLK